MYAIDIKNVTKKFGNYVAVNNLSLSIEKNIIFGLLGSNGAGKTTTINMLNGLLLPDSGSIKIFDYDIIKDIEKIRKSISFVPQSISLYNSLTIYENLEFFGGLYLNNKELKQKIDFFIKKFNLEHKKNTKISNLSGGYQRRCSIACSMISSPKILFLDEPSEGIDLYTNKIIMDFIKSLKDVTVILTTHSIKEAEDLCDYVVFMHQGEKILEGNPQEIVKKYSESLGEKVIIDFDKKINLSLIKSYLEKSNYEVKNITIKGKSISFTTLNLGNNVVEILDSLISVKDSILDINIKKPTLEDIFNNIMEKKNEIV